MSRLVVIAGLAGALGGGCAGAAQSTQDAPEVDIDAVPIDAPDPLVVLISVPETEITTAQPSCMAPAFQLDFCLTAAHRVCATHGFVGGVGPLSLPGGTQRVACFNPPKVEVRTTSYATLSSDTGIPVVEVESGTRPATNAVNKFCINAGFAGGVGPIEHINNNLNFLCNSAPGAEVRSVPRAELAGCDLVTAPNAPACTVAADTACAKRGLTAGWGPLSFNATDAEVLCFRP